jgi:hypothetical protein
MASLTTIPDHYTTEFRTNWEHKAQQLESRLRQYVTIESFRGERMRFNLVASDNDPSEITDRAAATNHTNLDTEVRWLYTKGYDRSHLLDEWDEDLLGEVSAPNNSTLEALHQAFARHMDTRIIAAASGTAYTGADGTVATDFDTTNQVVAVNYVAPGATPANSNLTIDKLIETKSKFGRAEVQGQDMSGVSNEPIIMAVTQYQLDSLLRSTQVISADYNTVRALVSGEVDSFLGIKFVRMSTSRLSVASSVRDCYAWVPSGIKFTQGEHRVNLDVLPERSHALQIRVRCRNGGVRTQENKVVKVLCDETA